MKPEQTYVSPTAATHLDSSVNSELSKVILHSLNDSWQISEQKAQTTSELNTTTMLFQKAYQKNCSVLQSILI